MSRKPSEPALEILRVCEALSPEKQKAVAEFARSLFTLKENALDQVHADDERWEELIAEKKSRPRLAQFLAASAQEKDEPLDPERM